MRNVTDIPKLGIDHYTDNDSDFMFEAHIRNDSVEKCGRVG